ncbi:hypothetical protein GCM10009533_57460 [Saccharopolyspora spinosporotrichia]|uniref:Uncharacterized protein n=1 Tax=Saccharopolyspora erythraea TaxID=1836 RepID=A0ABN1DT76_SACER
MEVDGMRTATRQTAGCLENPLIPETCRGPGGGERPRNSVPNATRKARVSPPKTHAPPPSKRPASPAGCAEVSRAPTLKATRHAKAAASKARAPPPALKVSRQH